MCVFSCLYEQSVVSRRRSVLFSHAAPRARLARPFEECTTKCLVRMVLVLGETCRVGVRPSGRRGRMEDAGKCKGDRTAVKGVDSNNRR